MNFSLSRWLLCFVLFWPVTSLAKLVKPTSPQTDWSFVEKKLKKSGFNKKFIKQLKSDYETKHFEMVLKLNVLLFLVTSDYHGVQVTEEGIKNVRSFLKKNEKFFIQAEKEYGVSRHVIASLLWIETRHGQNQGTFHVASSFLHLLQADRKDIVAYLQNKAPEFNKKVSAKQKKEIQKRTVKKAEWALKELKALESLHKRDPKLAFNLRGSFSGAFGLPQFLPSSYGHWARASQKNAVPDLYKPSDAICSVGHYLQKHGWKWKKNKTHVKALMKYNNSRDYAEAILKLAEKSKEKVFLPKKRLPSSQKGRLPAKHKSK
jgi:membrane-bound lytic murein transglycosylase B